MRIVVFSDTHGRISKCISAMERFGKVDMIIHLGDIMRDAEDLKAYFETVPVQAVCGNCELPGGNSAEKTFEVCGKKIYMTHGHIYNVKSTLREIADKVKSEGADIGLFGHTHKSFDGDAYGARLLNPGSCALPAEGVPTCGIIEIENGRLKTMIAELN